MPGQLKLAPFMTFLLSLILVLFINGCSRGIKNPVDYVNPNIGTIGHLLRSTSPTVQVPHGAVRLSPSFTAGIVDKYLADKIVSFPVGASSMMATTGEVKVDAAENASKFDHDLETATPYYYAALLEDYDIEVEYTVTTNAVYFKFKFSETSNSNILLSMRRGAELEIIDENIIQGTQARSRRGTASAKVYFHAEFSLPFESYGTWSGEDIVSGSRKQSGDVIGGYATYYSSKVEQVEMKVGISDVSMEQARQNLNDEIPDWDFEEVKNNARDLWNEALNLIRVEGGTEDQRTIFYTAFYRTMGRKGNVWDTYRCAYPLQTIVEPAENMRVIREFISAYEETGWVPSSGAMIGHHSTPVIVDAYVKGLRDFDVEKAYEGMKKNAMEATMIPWRDQGPLTEIDRVYLEKGFFPALPAGEKEWVAEVDGFELRQSVAVTLEHCYDDWCLAQMAKALGKDEDYGYFIKRAHNYQNLFDPKISFMAPKTADGRWVEPFDPKLSGGQGGRAYFAECNSWTYSWHIQHDVQGLINLMGGREQFVKRLDSLFVEQYTVPKYHFLSQFPDATGLIGQYVQGNEPSFHIPYLYNYAGAPWQTQRRVRDIMKIWYGAGPLGICGDEDGGAMSSWYVFSAMGFYPQCPGRPVYDIGSPIFEKVTIKVGEGKTFVIEARNVSAKNKYIQSATLNGKPLNKPWFEHSDLVKGGTLVLNMGARPNKEWGSAPEAAPPSMSSPPSR